MTCISAVGVYDNLTPSQTCISVRSADNKTSGRVDEELCLCIYQFLRQDRIKHVFLDILMDLLLCNIIIMLCGQYDSFQTKRLSILIILNGNLCLSVRSQIGKCAVLAHPGQL